MESEIAFQTSGGRRGSPLPVGKMTSLNIFIGALSYPPAAAPLSAADLRGETSLFAFVHQSTTLWTESSCIDPRAQTMNFAAASGFWPLALATKAHPPRSLLGFPPGGTGSGKTPYLKSLALSRRALTAQIPTFCMAQ